MIEYGHLIHRFGHLDGQALLVPMLREVFPGRLVVVSSFGAESAVLLHMAASIDRSVPVIFLDTGKIFAETLAYRDRLISQLKLDNVRSVSPDAQALERHDPGGDLHRFDPDGCCRVRKVEPLERALAGVQAWVGCVPCTQAPGPGGGLRDGRWAGTDKTECGIHWTLNGRPMRQVSGS
jgi:phosphoadenosine phosphosulfate reductase